MFRTNRRANTPASAQSSSSLPPSVIGAASKPSANLAPRETRTIQFRAPHLQQVQPISTVQAGQEQDASAAIAQPEFNTYLQCKENFTVLPLALPEGLAQMHPDAIEAAMKAGNDMLVNLYQAYLHETAAATQVEEQDRTALREQAQPQFKMMVDENSRLGLSEKACKARKKDFDRVYSQAEEAIAKKAEVTRQLLTDNHARLKAPIEDYVRNLKRVLRGMSGPQGAYGPSAQHTASAQSSSSLAAAPETRATHHIQLPAPHAAGSITLAKTFARHLHSEQKFAVLPLGLPDNLAQMSAQEIQRALDHGQQMLTKLESAYGTVKKNLPVWTEQKMYDAAVEYSDGFIRLMEENFRLNIGHAECVSRRQHHMAAWPGKREALQNLAQKQTQTVDDNCAALKAPIEAYIAHLQTALAQRKAAPAQGATVATNPGAGATSQLPPSYVQSLPQPVLPQGDSLPPAARRESVYGQEPILAYSKLFPEAIPPDDTVPEFRLYRYAGTPSAVGQGQAELQEQVIRLIRNVQALEAQVAQRPDRKKTAKEEADFKSWAAEIDERMSTLYGWCYRSTAEFETNHQLRAAIPESVHLLNDGNLRGLKEARSYIASGRTAHVRSENFVAHEMLAYSDEDLKDVASKRSPEHQQLAKLIIKARRYEAEGRVPEHSVRFKEVVQKIREQENAVFAQLPPFSTQADLRRDPIVAAIPRKVVRYLDSVRQAEQQGGRV